ncbi:MAG TPA: AMP-binding protein [Actinomycetota bacterium]|nr:AMP-binding protein [Actinomycetota bacterium]
MTRRNPIERVRSARRLASAGVLRRAVDAGFLDPRSMRAGLRASPWLLGRGGSLGWLSQVNALARPGKPAVIDRGGTLTWREVDARANRLARGLGGLGVAPGDTVSLLLRNGREFAEAVYACHKRGNVVAPLNTWAKAQELRGVLEQVRPKALLYDGRHAAELRDAVPEGTRLVEIGDGGELPGVEPYEALLARQEDGHLSPVTLRRGSRRLVIQTSGTTGRPKGAARAAGAGELQALLARLSVVPYRREDVVLIPAPLFHSFGMLTLSIASLLGATMVLPESFEPEQTLQLIDLHRATAASLVPVMIRRTVSLPDEVRSRYDVSSLRILLASGSALTEPVRAAAREVFGDVLYDLYGSTETGWVAIATPGDMRARPGTVGRPVPGVDVAVFSRDGKRLGHGEVGALYIRSNFLFEGYTSGERKDERRGYVSIGDVGHVDDRGYVFVEGRGDDMVVVGGENVYPAEVEQAIERVAGVGEVAVVGIPDEEYGHVLAAYVVGTASEDLIRETCRRDLASFKVPRRIEVLDELPRTATGKVLKRELVRR